MKVFLSSLIIGMEPFRAAAREALTTLRHEPTMSEGFSAQPNSPQVACLSRLQAGRYSTRLSTAAVHASAFLA